MYREEHYTRNQEDESMYTYAISQLCDLCIFLDQIGPYFLHMKNKRFEDHNC